LLLAVAAAVVAFATFGKVLSPQYLVWVAAAVPLALGRVRPFALVATVAALLLTRYIYVDGYLDLLEAGRVSWVMLARNLVLVALFCSLVLELAARGGGSGYASTRRHDGRLRTAVTRACTAAGVPELLAADLRHRRISLLNLGGVPWATMGQAGRAARPGRNGEHLLACAHRRDRA
jgi:hypothetical protein